MPKIINQLSDRKVRSLSKPGLYADGGNVYLQISTSGTKSWSFRFKLNKKSREMGLGSVHTTCLAEARESAAEQRRLLRDGVDPIEHRKVLRAAKGLETARSKTFEDCAEAYVSAFSASWRNPKHQSQWINTLGRSAALLYWDGS